MDKDFWKGKKVFITGHTGFKGSWLSIWLHKLGAEITGYSLPPEDESMFNICGIDKIIKKNVYADVNNLKDLKKAMAGNEIVFHLAAQALVRESYDKPIYTMQTNIMGTANVLEACTDNDVKSTVIVTTDKVYENKEWVWGYREDDNLGGDDPYSASKACAELLVNSYRASFNLPVATARAGNVIGGGDFACDRIVPDCIRASRACQSIVLRNPDATRPFQHVLEPLRGYIKLAELLYINGFSSEYDTSFNFGSDESMSVIDLAKNVSNHIALEIDTKLVNNLHEAHNLKLDSSNAKEVLKWRSTWNINEAVNQTINWYKAYLNNEEMYNYTLKQMEYFELCK